MPAEDNMVINGEEGPTLKGMALLDEEGRFLHVRGKSIRASLALLHYCD